MNRYNKILWEDFIYESPWLLYHPPLGEFNKNMENIDDYRIKKLGHVENFFEFAILEIKNGSVIELFLIKNDKLAVLYSYKNHSDGHIQTIKSWNSKEHMGSFMKFFAEIIVPKYKIVESDEMLSNNAFNMWRKMIVAYPDYNYYVKDNDELFPIKNPYEIDMYKEPMSIDKKNSTFIVEYK